ncbi:malonate decarboxylase holo-ACP synthase [Bradyrhizobium sp. 31Argb]|uniref:malonate decarboxylase holo-ACP synthase n=1 Tax=unclassified Bradyrhizobium TaxID=2631580 RepID=UPI0013EEC8CE|nr:malonate decarboxylase holo-ACP synthase [Bradyrhizobium sp. Leo170]
MTRQIGTPHKFRPHDLVWIDDPRSFIAATPTPTPAWVATTLAAELVMVVRRGRVSPGLIPVGVRGSARDERFAGAVASGSITRRVRPEDLLSQRQEPTQARRDAMPALEGFYAVMSAWADLNLPWGPVGSVGFELATGVPVATASSDLDLVVYAASYLSEQDGNLLLEAVAGIDAVADIQVETPQGGFSLREYCDGRSLRRRLKTCDGGARLVRDPWSNA